MIGSNVEVRSERVLPVSDRDGLQEVPIEMTIVGSIRDTVAALARLEHTDRLLVLKDVKIRVVAVGQPRAADHAHRRRLSPAGDGAGQGRSPARPIRGRLSPCPDDYSPSMPWWARSAASSPPD
jgi:hypothetical protein